MASIASTSTFISEANYTYPIQLPLSVQIPSNAQSYTVTPPESTASGGGNVRGYRLEDVGRLSDMEEDGENINAIGTKENDVKQEITILEEDENLSAAVTSGVQMVNIRPNGKISLCDPNSNKSKVHPSSLAYMKEVMKDIIVDIRSKANINDLIVLQGADDGVAVHRSVITHYSKLVQDQVDSHPDCSTVFLTFFSSDILQKVVALLYYGECYFPEEDKKCANLVWEAMRCLLIKHDDKSFFCHPVGKTAVKVEVEDAEDQQTIPDQPVAEVDQTDEIWYEDHQTVNSGYAYEYMKILRVPHPDNPNKTCSVQTKYGKGVRILRGLPAMQHINGDEIKAAQILKDKEETKKRLEENQVIFVDLSDEADECPTPTKKSRTQEYPASTSIVRDEEFKKLFASGKFNLNMIKGASANCKKPNAAVPSTSNAAVDAPPTRIYALTLCSPPASFNHHDDQLGNTVVSTTIPGNNPARTGISIMQSSKSTSDEIKDEEVSPPSSPSPTKSISGMPKLQLATGTECQVPKRRTVHARSLDITEGPIPILPTLDKMMIDDDTDNQEALGGNEFFPDTANSTTLMLLAPAAVIPKARVNNFLKNRQIPSTSAGLVSQMENVGSGQRTPKSRRTKTVPPPSPDVVEATAEMRVAYAKEEELKSKCFIVASKKIPVPDDLSGDNVHYYVENMEHNPNDDEVINNLPESSRAILSRHETTSETELEVDTPAPRGRRGGKGVSKRGTGRGRGRPSNIANLNSSYPDVTMTEVETESQTNISNQPESSRQTRPVRSRGGGRRGSRGGGAGK